MNPAEPGAAVLHLVSADGARLSVHRHGAHVVSWTPADGRERLYLSGRSASRPDAAIRGGIPVIFPQFAAEGPLPRHGFARTARWAVADPLPESGQAPVLRLRLVDDAATRAVWPQAFVAELVVRLARQHLAVSLAVRNSGPQPLAFTAALHTYLAVAAIEEVRIIGLRGCRYRDSANGGAPCVETAEALAIDGEVDRVYFDTPQSLRVVEPDGALTVAQSGFADTVVWNPGAAKAALLADLDPGGERRFVCVEAAAVGRPIRLAPGERWVGTQTLIA